MSDSRGYGGHRSAPARVGQVSTQTDPRAAPRVPAPVAPAKRWNHDHRGSARFLAVATRA